MPEMKINKEHTNHIKNMEKKEWHLPEKGLETATKNQHTRWRNKKQTFKPTQGLSSIEW